MNKFISKDLYISSMLYSKGKEFLGVNEAGGTYWFIFDDSSATCNKLVSDYWLKKVQVDALSFVEAIRTLKSFIFAEKGADRSTT